MKSVTLNDGTTLSFDGKMKLEKTIMQANTKMKNNGKPFSGKHYVPKLFLKLVNTQFIL